MTIDYMLILAAPVLIGLYVLYKTVILSSINKIEELENDPYAFRHESTLPETHRAPVWTPHPNHQTINQRAQEIINQNRAIRQNEVIYHYTNRNGTRVPDGVIVVEGPISQPQLEALREQLQSPVGIQSGLVNEPTPAPLQDNRRLELS